MMRIHLAVLFLAACASAVAAEDLDDLPTSSAERKSAAAGNLRARSLAGDWQLFLPAGFERQVQIMLINDDEGLYRLVPDALNISGHYRMADARLRRFPTDRSGERPGTYTWKVRSPYMLVLEEQTTDVGADYTGAILFRNKHTAAERANAGRGGTSETKVSTGAAESVRSEIRQTWKYRVVPVSNLLAERRQRDVPSAEWSFNELGDDGWELIQLHRGVAIFKRPTQLSD